MRKIVSSLAAVLLAGSAWAGTTLKSNVPPIVDFCDSGNCNLDGGVCATNTDCSFGSISVKSKVSLTGAGELKVQLKNVVDSAGENASGDYILHFFLDVDPAAWELTVKVPVVDGKGKAEIDLSSFMPSPGFGAMIGFTSLYTPAAVPMDCPGTNSSADITARQGDPDCISGNVIAAIGVASGERTTFKANVVARPDYCSGICAYNANFCTTNNDCSFGTLSPKSKASITGEGRLKVGLKGVVDSAGMNASGDYILTLNLEGATNSDHVSVKVTVVDGSGKVDVDLSTFMGPAGEAVEVRFPFLITPPPVPGDCPGTNSADDIAARQGDADCVEGRYIGAIGVLTE